MQFLNARLLNCNTGREDLDLAKEIRRFNWYKVASVKLN